MVVQKVAIPMVQTGIVVGGVNHFVDCPFIEIVPHDAVVNSIQKFIEDDNFLVF